MRHAMTGLLSTFAAISLMAGCASDGGDASTNAAAAGDPTVRPTAGSQTSAGRAPRDEPATSENIARQSGEPSNASDLVLIDVRATESEGSERIVLEFSGTGTPGWVVNYVDDPVLQGSGEGVDLGGRATLDIYASRTTWPAPNYYSGPTQFTPPNGDVFTDVYVGGTFEGYTQVLAGIDSGPAPFRVVARTNPSRLIIDVVDESSE